MTNIKEILSNIQERLRTAVPELAYIDKDRGQLVYGSSAVQYPCALLDVGNIDYTLQGRGVRTADTQVLVTVADLPQTTTSSQASEKEEAFRIMDLTERIHTALHLFTAGDYSPLCCTNLKKVCRTAFEIGYDTGETTMPMAEVKLEIDRK